jgi:hypothetical protein
LIWTEGDHSDVGLTSFDLGGHNCFSRGAGVGTRAGVDGVYIQCSADPLVFWSRWHGGTGILTLDGKGGSKTFTPDGGGLDSLSFSIHGGTFTDTFTLNNTFPGTSATFDNGNLLISYFGFFNTADTLVLNTGGGYFFHHFLGNLRGVDSAGFYSGSVASPLPPTWTMMLIGLAGFGLMLYRRNGGDGFAGVVPT